VGATDNGILAKTTGGVTYEPVSTSFAAAQTFPYNTNYILADGASSLTIGKAGNSANITMNSAQTVAGPISIYGGTVAVNGALSATNATLSIESSTAVTQTAAITASNLALTGAGTVTLNNASNAIETIAGGTATNRLGSLSFTDASGGLTIGTIGSLSGIYTNTGVVSVETLTGDINLNQSVSTNNTTAAALIINAGKNAVIGVSLGGNIQVSGNPAITTGSGGIAKLFSGLESNSTGLTGLVGANNARFSYDETTTTFVPALAVNNAYAIYRTSLGIGDLTIVSSGGDTINTTWKYENGVISTTTSPVNINAAILQDYLSSGALTIEAGNVTISGAITSTANAAFVINSNGTKTITVNAAVSLGGAITFNSNDFMLGNGTNISTSSASNITINANGNFGTTSTTRRTISSANGTITIHADKDANGTGQLDLDYLTFNPGTGATLIRGETVSFTPGATAGPYINGTGSFTFEPSDPSFGEVIYTSWFEIDKDNNGISALTLGKIGNSSNIQQNTNFTIAGPIQYYGGYVNINGTLTSSANGDILLKGIANTNSSVLISSVGGITKSAGTGTLTLQGHGRTQNSGTISATGAGVLNLVMWSDYDGDNVGGGSTLSTGGSISTNGGHVWMGGSSTNAGSYNWNGLAVGDGPSVGASGANGNAIDIFGPITTNGGDLLLWAGNGSGGSNGIATNSGWQLNVGDGDIILITDVILGEGPSLFFKQSGGSFTLVPNDGDFGTTFNWNGETNTVTGFGTGWNFGGNFNYLWLENPASLTSLTIGKYDGMLSGSTPVVLSNSSNVTFSNTTATSIAGPINVYGGDITISQNLSTTNTTTGNILFNGTRILGTGNIAIASGRTATINVSSNSTYDGIISGTGSGLTKLGAGLLTLTKDHTYSGATTISAGDLQVGTGGSVSQASSGTINATSGVSIASGSKLILTPNENVVFAAPISGAGGVEIKGASGKYFPSIGTSWLTTSPVQLAANTTVLEALTRITGGKMGGTAITSGPVICVAYQKSYTALNNTATLQLQAFNGDSSNSYTKCVFLKLTQSGSNVMIQVDNSKLSTGAGYKNGSVLGTDISVGGLSMTLSTSGGSGYGISEVFMSGKVNFTGLLSYSGNTVLSNTVSSSTATYTGYNYTSKGTQEITDASSSFPSSSTVVNNGLVILNRTTPLTIASNMEGTEEVLQVGAAVTLTGTNTHTGNTTIDLNKSLIIGDGSNLGSITGNIINYGSLTFNRSDDSSYAGIISGSGTLTKLGDGLHTLTGLNSYTGATTITAGKLILERDIPATSSTSFSGSGHLVIQPSSNSFTNAITYPIAGFNIASTVGGLTIGKPSNTSNITFGSATTIAGSITAYGGTITANASLATTNSSNAPILLQGNKVFQNQGVLVQTNGSNITYDVTNSPWTTASDQGISLGTAVGTIATINAQGGDISLASSFASTGVTNTSTNPDVAILLRNSKIKTSGSGTVTLNGNAYDNASTNGDFIWGLMLHTNEVIQTEHGAISIAGTGGKANGNARGIIADNTVLKVLSVSGPITFTEVMPNGHSVANHTGTYFKPSATESIKIGADGTLVANSTSNVVFDVARITFDGIIAPTVVNTSGTVTIQPVGNQFEGAVSLAGLSLSNTATGLTVGKSTNTANITFANATIIAGPIIAYGGDIAINGALTATNSSISLQASGTVTQTAAITATNLELSGTGTFTLTNTSNNVGTIAGGTLSLKLGSLSYVDSNELTIGALTNPGIIASGKINIQTLTNNLNLNSNVVTDNTATDAIILNAGKSASIGTTTGGDIIVGGTPSVTTGTNGIAKLYSGSAVNSAGLTSLVGGLTNVRYETDETTTTFVPTLETGNSYAFYRETITLPPTVTNQSVCSGATVSDLVASGQDLKWYTTLEGGQALASNISVVAGTYYVSQTLSGNESARTAVVVSITPTVGAISSITGTSNLASDATTATYSVSPVSGATSYVWSLPSGLTLTGQTGPSITVAVSSTYTSGSISVYALNSCGQTSVRTITVRKGTDPIGGVSFSVTGAPILCSNATATYTATSLTGGSYVWEVPSGLTITSGQGTNVINVASGSNFSSGLIRVIYVTSSYTLNGSYTVSGVTQPSAMSGPTNLCGLATTTYSVTNVPGMTYVWSVPSGMAITGSSNSSSIDVSITGAVSGNVSVRAQNTCGISTATSLFVKSTPIMGWMTGTTRVCGAVQTTVDANGNITNNNASDTYTYSVVAAIGVSYFWTVPSGATLVSGQGTNSITVRYNLASFDTGAITVQGTNSCGAGSARSLSVSAVTGEIAGPTSLCSLTTATYSVPADLGTVFTWSLPEGISIISGQGTSSITVGITHPVKFNTTNQVSVQFTTACGGTRTLKLGVNCTDYTNLTSDYCGATGIDPYELLYATAVTGATDYQFNIYNGATLISTINSTTPSFRFYGINFAYGATYQVKVKVMKNGVYGVEGSSCTVTLGNLPTTRLQNAYCGSTGINPWNWLYANAVTGATSYRFNIYNGNTLVTSIDRMVPYFRFQGNTFAYGATYQVKIQVVQNGVYGVEGEPCSVTLESLPTIKLQNAYCGITDVDPWNWLYANAVTGATGYRFNIYNGSTLVTSIDRTVPFFRFQENTFVYGATYQVKIQVGQSGVYGVEGEACSVTIQSKPTTNLIASQCNATLGQNDNVYPIEVTGATRYAFDIYNASGDTFITTIENSYAYFRFSQGNFTSGNKYQVKVRVKYGNNYGIQGSACLVILSNPIARIDQVKNVKETTETSFLALQAYPNPFTASFSIKPLDGETTTLFYQVYDITGKMLESKSVEASEIQNYTIGADYPVGMYLVIARQGATTETFKMIKQ
jgi:autotransporter-associated beta strand protein